ncbi:hypothetical protein L9F63_008714, partial [Diploptera punctata]
KLEFLRHMLIIVVKSEVLNTARLNVNRNAALKMVTIEQLTAEEFRHMNPM